MSLHIAILHLHWHRPTVGEVRRAIVLVGYAASVPLVLMADRAGLLWPALLAVAAVAGLQVGRLRGVYVEQARHIAAMEGLQEVAHQQRLQIARFEDEQRFWWEVDVQDRRDRHINNCAAGAGARSDERSGR